MKRIKPLIALLAGLSLTVVACEGDLSASIDVDAVEQPVAISNPMDNNEATRDSAPTDVSDPTVISGRIVSLRTVEVDGAEVDHVLADVQTSDTAHTFLVDLGPAETLKRHSLEPVTGDRITISGEMGMFNGSPMLVADRLNNTSLAFDQPKQEQEQHATAQPREMLGIRQRLVAGKVLDVKEADINGQNHLLAKVETFGGHVAVIDLGMKEQMPKLSIEKGQQIFAFGTVGRLNKLPLVVAEKVGQILDVPGREMQEPTEPATFQRPADEQQPAPDNNTAR